MHRRVTTGSTRRKPLSSSTKRCVRLNRARRGKLTGIPRTERLVEGGGRSVTVLNKMLDRISICQPRDLAVAAGE
jgi:hypothetical protein